jgi:hypothetical protein
VRGEVFGVGGEKGGVVAYLALTAQIRNELC